MQTSGVTVLSVRLAATDRRALSQAWYSALHAVEHRHRGRSAGPRSSRAPELASGARSANRSDALSHRAGIAAPSRRLGGAEQPRIALTDRRAPSTALARRIERALIRHTRRFVPVTFTIRTADGRVHVLVRDDAERTRVIALCAPALRERVERALAQARFALAARGVRTEAA